jgi:hypothetical protein
MNSTTNELINDTKSRPFYAYFNDGRTSWDEQEGGPGYYVVSTDKGAVAKFFTREPEMFICGPFEDACDALNAFMDLVK